jgi:hypothetical protein
MVITSLGELGARSPRPNGNRLIAVRAEPADADPAAAGPDAIDTPLLAEIAVTRLAAWPWTGPVYLTCSIRERKENSRLYPGVKDTLMTIRAEGVRIIGYTESIAFWTEWRIRTLGLDGVLEVLYSSPDHDVPAGTDIADLRKLPPEEYGLKLTRHLHVPRGIEKPNPHVLQTILGDQKRGRRRRARPVRTLRRS